MIPVIRLWVVHSERILYAGLEVVGILKGTVCMCVSLFLYISVCVCIWAVRSLSHGLLKAKTYLALMSFLMVRSIPLIVALVSCARLKINSTNFISVVKVHINKQVKPYCNIREPYLIFRRKYGQPLILFGGWMMSEAMGWVFGWVGPTEK